MQARGLGPSMHKRYELYFNCITYATRKYMWQHVWSYSIGVDHSDHGMMVT